MSVWERLRRWGRRDRGEREPNAAGDARPAPRDATHETEALAPARPERAVDELAAALLGTERFDTDHARAVFARAVREGDGHGALVAVRRMAAGKLPEGTEGLVVDAAYEAYSRGDREGASTLLAQVLARADATAAAWFLAAELAEREGDVVEAAARYERTLARDHSFPAARERLARLRALQGTASGNERAAVGLTLLATGAVTAERYRIVSELGRGGAGVVFDALDAHTERRVALKIYHARGPASLARLVNEARVPVALGHPGVVRIYDLEPALCAIVMERCDGSALSRVLAAGDLEAEPAGRILASLARVLSDVHAAGVVHRDVKPSNVLLAPRGRVVLTDFGLAVRAGEARAMRAPLGEGTHAFLAPEARAGAPPDPAADVYAFGVTAGEMARVVAGASASPAWRAARSSLARCVAVDAHERPSMSAVAAELAAAFETS